MIELNLTNDGVIVIGNLHGCIHSLLRVFDEFGLPPIKRYLFLGQLQIPFLISNIAVEDISFNNYRNSEISFTHIPSSIKPCKISKKILNTAIRDTIQVGNLEVINTEDRERKKSTIKRQYI